MFFRLFDQELAYVERLLEEDIRNNSAWNQRFFVISHLHEKLEGNHLDQELKYSMSAIEKVPGNESSWNYICGYFFFVIKYETQLGTLN